MLTFCWSKRHQWCDYVTTGYNQMQTAQCTILYKLYKR